MFGLYSYMANILFSTFLRQNDKISLQFAKRTSNDTEKLALWFGSKHPET
jgi:hypothetical protein